MVKLLDGFLRSILHAKTAKYRKDARKGVSFQVLAISKKALRLCDFEGRISSGLPVSPTSGLF